MRVSDYLREDSCIVSLAAQDKEGVVREIAKKIRASGSIIDEERFITDVLERESLGSTGIGHQVGIPHARTSAVRSFVIGFGRAPAGIDFKALDDQPVKLVFLMGASPQELNFYLRVLAELSKLLMNNAFRQALLEAKSAAEVVGIVREFESR